MRSIWMFASLLTAAFTAGAGAQAADIRPLDLEPCPVEGSGETALCGRLAVPENWDAPEGRALTLNVVVLPAIAPSGAAPLFDLAGGPGAAVTEKARFYLEEGRSYRRNRDVVLLDQRGSGASAPLHCRGIEERAPLAPMFAREDVVECRAALEGGHDLAQFTTTASARDLDAVRRAVGADSIDLYALSFGTKLAQIYMRSFPDHVRSAVLSGSAPLDIKTPLHHARGAETVLRDVFADCRADPACAGAYPALEADWAALLARLDQEQETADGGARGPFAESFRGLLGSAAGQRRVPHAISRMAKGDFSPLPGPAQRVGAPPAYGLYLSIECAEGTALIADEEIGPAVENTFLGRYRIDRQREACAHWTRPEMPDGFYEPVRSAIPALFVVGGRDYVTPAAFTRRIAEGFSNFRVLVIEEMGHGPIAMTPMDCLHTIQNDFYAAGSAARLDTACAGAMRAPPFKLPD